MKRFLLAAGLAALAGACSFSPEDDPLPRVEPRALTATELEVVRSDNEFGLGLFGRLAADAGVSNVFISPLSVSTALGLTANGAAGETYEAMTGTLGKGGLDAQELNRSYRDLSELLSGIDPQVTVEIANSVWPREGLPLVDDFVSAATRWFEATVEPLDFSDPASAGRINRWADEKTHGMIPKVVDGLDPAAVLYLLNAVYFKGTWKARFDRDDTVEAPFHNADGTESTVPLMTMEASLPVLHAERFTAFDLAYGDSLFSMSVLLPDEGESAVELARSLTADTWAAWAEGFGTSTARVYLPRFSASYKRSLVPALTDLGMGVAFDGGRADFSRMVAGGGIWIGDVLHQAVVDVNEEGTEAAAVTTVVMVTCACTPEIRVDRPFVFLIRERTSGALLFLGLIQAL